MLMLGVFSQYGEILRVKTSLSALMPVMIDGCIVRKLREEYDKLEGALKKLGVEPECVATETEEDGYNAESDLEEESTTEQELGHTTATFTPATYTVDTDTLYRDRRPGPLQQQLARVDEVGDRCSSKARALLLRVYSLIKYLNVLLFNLFQFYLSLACRRPF